MQDEGWYKTPKGHSLRTCASSLHGMYLELDLCSSSPHGRRGLDSSVVCVTWAEAAWLPHLITRIAVRKGNTCRSPWHPDAVELLQDTLPTVNIPGQVIVQNQRLCGTKFTAQKDSWGRVRQGPFHSQNRLTSFNTNSVSATHYLHQETTRNFIQQAFLRHLLFARCYASHWQKG